MGNDFALGRNSLRHIAKALGGAAPRLFRPMYAGANMGHPSREKGFVLCSHHRDADGLHHVATQLDFRPASRRLSSPDKSIPERLPLPLICTSLAELSPGRSPGLGLKGRPGPQGRLKIGRDPILDNVQPSLRDLIRLHLVPRTTVLAKFSRPYGTELAPVSVASFFADE